MPAAALRRVPTSSPYLVSEGLLEAVPRAGFRLGSPLLELGGLIIDRAGLVDAVEGSTAALQPSAGQELHVGQLVERWVIYLHWEPGPTRVTMANRVGMRAPAFISGCGKTALAALDPEDADLRVRRVCRQEQISLTDMAALADEFASARINGYLMCRSSEPGRTSVAAAVCRSRRAAAGALSTAGPNSTFAPARVAGLGAVSDAAEIASRRLQSRRRSVAGRRVPTPDALAATLRVVS